MARKAKGRPTSGQKPLAKVSILTGITYQWRGVPHISRTVTVKQDCPKHPVRQPHDLSILQEGPPLSN